MLFAITSHDKACSGALRMATRPAHLEYLKARWQDIKLAGPFLDDAGEWVGSLMIVECADRADAAAFSAGDPYAKAGLFERVNIRAFRVNLEQFSTRTESPA
jgi:uncharacterized protein YciI